MMISSWPYEGQRGGRISVTVSARDYQLSFVAQSSLAGRWNLEKTQALSKRCKSSERSVEVEDIVKSNGDGTCVS